MGVSTRLGHVILGWSAVLFFRMSASADSTEAVNLPSPLIRQNGTCTCVTFMLPLGSICNNQLQQFCTKDAERELHCDLPNREYDESDNLTFTINEVESKTSYIFKTNNETLAFCTVQTRTTPDKPVTEENFPIDATSSGFDLLTPQIFCQSPYDYLLRYKSQNSEYTEWEDVKSIKTKTHKSCSSNVCIDLGKINRRMRLSIQVRVRRGREAAAGARRPREARRLPWLPGLWAALGAVAGLALVTTLGACYFERRAARREAEGVPGPVAEALPRLQSLHDLLAPHIDPLLDCEVLPEHTQPIAEQPTCAPAQQGL